MIQYRKILEMAQEGLSLRTVSASTGHGRPKVTEILQLAKEKGLECPLTEEMDDHWIEEFLYPYKAVLEKSVLSDTKRVKIQATA